MIQTVAERQKTKKSRGFAALGVPEGAILTSRKNPAIKATVVDGKNKVEYMGKEYSISGLAKIIQNASISGYHAFKYNGILLAKLGEPKTISFGTSTQQIQRGIVKVEVRNDVRGNVQKNNFETYFTDQQREDELWI